MTCPGLNGCYVGVRLSYGSGILVWIVVTFDAGKKRAHLWKIFDELSPTPTPYARTPWRVIFPISLITVLNLFFFLNLKKENFFCLVIFVRRGKMLLDQMWKPRIDICCILGCLLIVRFIKTNELEYPIAYLATVPEQYSNVWLVNIWHFSKITELLLNP